MNNEEREKYILRRSSELQAEANTAKELEVKRIRDREIVFKTAIENGLQPEFLDAEIELSQRYGHTTNSPEEVVKRAYDKQESTLIRDSAKDAGIESSYVDQAEKEWAVLNSKTTSAVKSIATTTTSIKAPALLVNTVCSFGALILVNSSFGSFATILLGIALVIFHSSFFIRN